MRILFRDARETEEYRALLHGIRRWWRAFAAEAERISESFQKGSCWDLPGWMDEYLHSVDPRLCWEFGPGEGGGNRLVVTPENEKHLRPLVDLLLAEAPDVPGWEFRGHRLAESFEWAAASVRGRTGGRIDDLAAEVREGPLNTVALRLVSPRYETDDEPEAYKEAFVAVESLLGEEVLDKWVGPITTGPPRPERRALPLPRVRPTVESLVGRIKEQMPRQPCMRRTTGNSWGAYTMEPSARLKTMADFTDRADLLTGVTMYWEMLQAATNGGAFFSERFSTSGETFCYVKIDGSRGLEGSAWADRGEIEESLDRALLARDLGACIGGGTGMRYSYVDLALTDLRAGCDVVRSVLREGKLPLRSWVLFFDATLKAEWVGIHDEAPPPP